jgi:hypothetical protein
MNRAGLAAARPRIVAVGRETEIRPWRFIRTEFTIGFMQDQLQRFSFGTR